MSGTTLQYFTKQSSALRMEDAFNSDYDRLLMLLEEYAVTRSMETYGQVFALLALIDDDIIDDSIKSTMATLFGAMIFDIYRTADNLYRPWYLRSFGHLKPSGLETFPAVYNGAVESMALARAATVTPILTSSVSNLFSSDSFSEDSLDDYSELFSTRISRTETNGAAGSILEATAVGLFSEGALYKRWMSRGDERVRYTHQLVASMRAIPLNRLYQVGDSFMRFPADPQAFGGNVAGEVVNCRCRSIILPYTGDQSNSGSLNQLLVGL
jgi:hypothetical protein